MPNVWFEDIRSLHYVRVHTVITDTRSKAIKKVDIEGRVVGYEVLPSDAPGIAPRAFERKVYTVRDYDRCCDPQGIYANRMPSEAVPVAELLSSKDR